MKVNVLISEELDKNEYAFIFPLLYFKKEISAQGITIQIYDSISPALYESDVLLISSKVGRLRLWWKPENIEKMFGFLQRAKEKTGTLVWADLGDSTGSTHFEILKYVDQYWKGSVLKDRKKYLQKMYGNRMFTDYYHRKFSIEDKDPGEEHLNYIPEKKQLDKVQVSWNQAYLNYSYFGFHYDSLRRKIKGLPCMRISRFKNAEAQRNNLLSCRISANYPRNTIAFQRKKIMHLLKDELSAERVSRKKFYDELESSRIVISPFGWGEICYRDFETLIAGACLMKPDCSHLETWPDLYHADETYIPFKWDFSDLESQIDKYKNDTGSLTQIANRAQEHYKKYYDNKTSGEFFAAKLQKLL